MGETYKFNKISNNRVESIVFGVDKVNGSIMYDTKAVTPLNMGGLIRLFVQNLINLYVQVDDLGL